MNRRDFAKRLGLAATAAGTDLAVAQSNGQSATPKLYYVDGYHGGVKGHMPPGSWRDILNAMRDLPDWKLCLDIEPASWDFLKREDPQAYNELKTYLGKQPVNARVEIVNGTFGQPFGWANGGESNVRQITRGIKIIRAHFPDATIETYAVQEPCWASCLPQLLRSLGFHAAVLKNPSTAWGGYSAGFDAEMVNWKGPDGTSIPTVPRYACEELVKTWETESVTGSPEFARKCVANGIAHPAGMCFQDLGWAAKPKVAGEHIQFVTWREYIRTIADQPSKEWRFSMEDILVTLPWGEKTLQAAAQQVRSAETRLLMAEKVAAMAWLERRHAWRSQDLEGAWDRLLWAQHHDSWITVTTRSGRRAWAFQVGAGTMDAEETASAILADAAAAMSAAPSGDRAEIPVKGQWVRVFNTLSVDRSDLAELTLATDRGTRAVRVTDGGGKEVVAQVIPSRRYLAGQTGRGGPVVQGNQTQAQGQSINTATILFRPTVPAAGYATYRVEPVYSEPSVPHKATTGARSEADGTVTIENDLYRVRLDPTRGGAITSLYSKPLSREFCDPAAERAFNEYRGYFITQKKWRSSTEEGARVTVLENGPLRARVQVSGKVGGCPYQTTVTLAEGQSRIDFHARFVFEQDTWIGDPWDIQPEARRTERRRSQNDGRWKLQALFPVSLKDQAVYKNAAYDVCRSRNTDTFFQRWDEIKHNIVLNWVDVVDEKQNAGLAVFSDHTTAYTHGPEHPLSLVMAWGWEGGFWWGKCPLRGVQQLSYSIAPHAGKWDEARLWTESCRLNEPPLTQLMDGKPATGAETRSLVTVSGNGVEIPTMLVEGRRLLIRLFNAEGDESERVVSLHGQPSRVELVELDGRAIRQLNVQRSSAGRYEVRLGLPRFGIRTLRCEFPNALA
jgi:alpha-mannosidase